MTASHLRNKAVRRQDNVKGGAFTRAAVRAKPAAVIFDDLFTHGKPDPGAAELLLVVKSFEDTEDLLRILLAKTYAVVFDLDMEVLVIRGSGDRNDRQRIGPGVFQRIGKKIAEKLGHL